MANSKKENGQRPNSSILGRTLFLMTVCGIVAFAGLIMRLYKLMIIDHGYYEEQAIEQQTRETTVSASRGTIYDRNGNALAISATAYNIYISPYEIEYYGESVQYIASGLSEILGVDYDSIVEKTQKTKSWYQVISSKVETNVADEVRELINNGDSTDGNGKAVKGLKGVHVEVTSKRYYPYSTLACHVIGFVGTDNTGLEGLESVYNSYLEGTDGSVVRLSASNGIELLFENYENYNDAIDGNDLQLTIDINVQSIAEKYLEQAVADNMIQNGGCVIVMNVKTGEILALACSNEYDLNNPFTLTDEDYEELQPLKEQEDQTEYVTELTNRRLAQWRNMAISDTYEPGSVFKILTMSMGLEDGVISAANSSFYCGGSMEVLGRGGLPLKCWKTAGHGAQTLKEAAMHSCNVAFVNIGLSVGAERFYDYVEAFGLWEKTGIDLAGETSTRGLWWSDEVFKDPTNLSQLAAASFGQTANVTPIQMITAVSAACNGGYLMEPYIVSEISDDEGNVVYSKQPTVVRQVISEETSKTVCEILEAVVGEEGGTGKNAYVAGYRVGGKTGTTTKTAYEAATGIREYMVSFCGVAPMDNPEIAVLMVLDNPSKESGVYVSGGAMAAPFVGRIIGEVLPYMGVEPIYDTEEEQLLDVTMPKVIGSTVEDARTILEARGFTVKVMGAGDSVTDQLPNANVDIAAGSKVIIYTDSEKSEEEVTVPNVMGMTAANAQRTLASYGLFMETSGALPTDSNIIVSNQSVPGGSTAQYGSIVSVTLVDKSSLGQY